MSQSLISGQPSKRRNQSTFNPDVHIPLLERIFVGGEGVMAFCAEARISRMTFFRWLKQFSEFKECYDIAINQAGRLWEAYPMEVLKRGQAFNYQYWHLIMRNRFAYSGICFPLKSDHKTPEGKFTSAWDALRDGYLTAQDYKNIVEGIVGELRAQELELKAKELSLKQQELDKTPWMPELNSKEARAQAGLILQEALAKISQLAVAPTIRPRNAN